MSEDREQLYSVQPLGGGTYRLSAGGVMTRSEALELLRELENRPAARIERGLRSGGTAQPETETKKP